MRVGVLALAAAIATGVLGCEPSGIDGLKDSHFYCRATVVPNANTTDGLPVPGMNTKGGDPIYFYGECLPTEAACRERMNGLCFEQAVAWCYRETALGSDNLYLLCFPSAHVCTDWRNTRMRDMGERVKSDCEMMASSQLVAEKGGFTPK